MHFFDVDHIVRAIQAKDINKEEDLISLLKTVPARAIRRKI